MATARHDSPRWTPAATAHLARVPHGHIRDLVRQRVDELAMQTGIRVVTKDLVEAKYQQWSDGASPRGAGVTWTEDARTRVDRIPPFVRHAVVSAVEKFVTDSGFDVGTPELLDESKRYWEDTSHFH